MKRFTPSVVDKYLIFLDGYGEYRCRFDSLYSIENAYDFDTENALVAKCEAGELISINDLPPRESEC